jgi:hypothetical protein
MGHRFGLIIISAIWLLFPLRMWAAPSPDRPPECRPGSLDFWALPPAVSSPDGIGHLLVLELQNRGDQTCVLLEAHMSFVPALILWDDADKIVNRTMFAGALDKAFAKYIGEIQAETWDSDLWKKARRKVWWLIQLSS